MYDILEGFEGYIPFYSYGGLVIDDEKILLREPTNHYGGYVWTFPEGQQDEGETPEQTALREVTEETGYHTEIISLIDFPFKGDISDTYFFIMKPLENINQFDGETTSIKWVSYTEALKMVFMNKSVRDIEILNYLRSNNYL